MKSRAQEICCYLTITNIFATVGEEMFTDYGGSHWFDLRNLTLDAELVSAKSYTTV